MTVRWDDSHRPGVLAALAVSVAAALPWFVWWPQADREGFDRFLFHMLRLIWPTCAAILAAGFLAEAMCRTSLRGKVHTNAERLGNLLRAAGLLLGATVHFSLYHPSMWMGAGWLAGGAIGFGLPLLVIGHNKKPRA